MDKIAVIGLGYVGLPLALEFAKKYPTCGYDINAARVEELRGGKDHTLEANEEDLKTTTITFTADVADIADCNIYIIGVPTPTDKHQPLKHELAAIIHDEDPAEVQLGGSLENEIQRLKHEGVTFIRDEDAADVQLGMRSSQ